MNIDITRLKSGIDEYIPISLVYSFSKDELSSTNIISLDNVSINGSITKEFDDFSLNLTVSGVMVLPCSLTLKPTNHEFSIEIEEVLGENYKNNQNSLDIFPIIWENILMEIPMKVVSEDATNYKIEGNGWKLITEDDVHEEINPELAKLKDLL